MQRITLITVVLIGSVSCSAMRRTPSYLFRNNALLNTLVSSSEQEVADFVWIQGGIAQLTNDELEMFVRNKGGYSALTGDELNQIIKRKFALNPESYKPFLEARNQRKKRQKELKLAAMIAWSKEQVVAYVNALPAPIKIDCDELNILNAILEGPDPLTGSKKKYRQEKYVPFMVGQERWPHLDLSLLSEEKLDNYTNSFLLTDVEAEFVTQRHREIRQLEEIDTWDREQAMSFVQNLLHKDSVSYEQWRKISCKIGLPLIQLKPLVKPMSRFDFQMLLEAHNQELAEREKNDKTCTIGP